MIRVLPFGDFWTRQPLAYPPLAEALEGRVALTEDPAEAQLAVFAHSHDLSRHGRRLAGLLARYPRLRAVLLSEEPFWDSCWAEDPFSAVQSHRLGQGAALSFAVLNHHTGSVFRARTVPYFLLTDPRYVAALRPLLSRNAGRTAQDWLAHWRQAPLDAAFMAEKRTLPRHAPAYPAQGVWGLSLFRTRLARHCRGARVLRRGQGWDDGPPRTGLPDWHAGKLAELDLRCRYLSAVENTHQAGYVTEKIFDAFAVGAIPLYVAGPGHDVVRLVGEAGWVNLWDRLERGGGGPPGFGPARAFDATRMPDLAFAGAYAAVQARLARRFETDAEVQAETARFAAGLAEALARLVR